MHLDRGDCFIILFIVAVITALVLPLFLQVPQNNQPSYFINIGQFKVTAYCPCEKCCGKWADGITASGYRIVVGSRFVAAPPEIPFGTILDIPGYGIVPVLDRGGVIKGKRLDVFFDTHQEALNWGVQHLMVKEVSNG